MARVLHPLVENELRHWPHQRVTGTFFFAKETASGAAVLVDQRTQKVYEVLGISTSIGDIMRSGGRFTKDDVLGATIKLTLLPYMAKIVYDGTLFGAPPAGASEAAEARAAAEAAEAEGTVLRELPAHVESLVGKRVDISASGQPELNGTTGTATAWSRRRGGTPSASPTARRWRSRWPTWRCRRSRRCRIPAAAGGIELSASEQRAQERLRALRQRKGDGASGPFGEWGTPRPRTHSTSPPSPARRHDGRHGAPCAALAHLRRDPEAARGGRHRGGRGRRCSPPTRSRSSSGCSRCSARSGSRRYYRRRRRSSRAWAPSHLGGVSDAHARRFA